jgi:hypothetical protein
MAHGFFGRRRDNGPAGWPQLPAAAATTAAPALDAASLAYVKAIASAAPPPEAAEPLEATTPQAALLFHIGACRSAVADALYEASRDYQVLCGLVHEKLPACEETIAELRRRLDGNLHYAVLAKLDEAYALAEAGAKAASRK